MTTLLKKKRSQHEKKSTQTHLTTSMGLHVNLTPMVSDHPPVPPRRSRRHDRRTRGAAIKERTPEEPRLFGSGPHDLRLTAHLDLDQLVEVLTTLLQPEPTNFAGGPPTGRARVDSKFRTARFLAASSSCQSGHGSAVRGYLGPAWRQTRATALSKANPRWPNTPTFAQTARWWPKTRNGTKWGSK